MCPVTAPVPLPWSRTLIWILTLNLCNAIRWSKGRYAAASCVNGATLLVVGLTSTAFVVSWFLIPDWIPRANSDSAIYPEINSVHWFWVFVTNSCWIVSVVLFRWSFRGLADIFNELHALWISSGQPVIRSSWLICVVASLRFVWFLLALLLSTDSPPTSVWFGMFYYVFGLWGWMCLHFIHLTIFLYMAYVYRICCHCIDNTEIDPENGNSLEKCRALIYSTERVVSALQKILSPLAFFSVITIVSVILQQWFLLIVPITSEVFTEIGPGVFVLLFCYSVTLLTGLQAETEFRNKIEQMRFQLIKHMAGNISAEVEFNVEMDLRFDRITKIPKAMGFIDLHLQTLGSASTLIGGYIMLFVQFKAIFDGYREFNRNVEVS